MKNLYIAIFAPAKKKKSCCYDCLHSDLTEILSVKFILNFIIIILPAAFPLVENGYYVLLEMDSSINCMFNKPHDKQCGFSTSWKYWNLKRSTRIKPYSAFGPSASGLQKYVSSGLFFFNF